MADPHRIQVSLRLKAARYLAGRAGSQGVVPLPVSELAEHSLLRDNRITRNRIEEIEQMKVTARPLELDALARALELPPDWFSEAQDRLPIPDEGGHGLRARPAEVNDRDRAELEDTIGRLQAEIIELRERVGLDDERRRATN
jgi:transcriptional regulator with XRE-family HTH domain